MCRSARELPAVAAILGAFLIVVAPAFPATAGVTLDLEACIRDIVPDTVRAAFYAATEGDDDIVRFGTNGFVTGTIREPLLSKPVRMAVSPDGTELYVSYDVGNTLRVYSLPSLSFIADVPLPSWAAPYNILATPTRLYVSCGYGTSGYLAIIDRSTLDVLYLGQPPGVRIVPNAEFALSPDGTRLIATKYEHPANRVVMIDVTSDSPIQVGNDCQDSGGTAGAFFYSPDGSRFYMGSDFIEIFKTQDNGLLYQTHAVPVEGRGMAMSSDGGHIYTWMKENAVASPVVAFIDTAELLPYRAIGAAGDLASVNMVLSSDNAVLALNYRGDSYFPGCYFFPSTIELINVTENAANRGGFKFRNIDDLEVRPFEHLKSQPVGKTGHIDIKAGIWAMTSMQAGSAWVEIQSDHHFEFLVYPIIENGAWDDLGELTVYRAPTHPLEDIREICIEEPLLPGVTTTVSIHGRNFASGVTLLEVSGNPITFGPYSEQGWATISAQVTLAPDHLPGFHRDNFHAVNPGGNMWPGQYFVPHPDSARLGFTTFLVEVDEGGGSAELEVGRLQNSSGMVSVQFETQEGSASARR